MSFEEHWNFIVKRSQEACIPVVQDKDEIKYIYNLIQGCESYLEVGTAEGNGLYVMAQALSPKAEITYIDYGEKHTTPHRNFILDKLQPVTAIHGDSNDFDTAKKVFGKQFDVVFIDAGHDDFNVAIDALFYGPLAKKYLIFHDIKLPDVARVFDWYAKQRPDCKALRVINSETYGYGVLCMQ